MSKNGKLGDEMYVQDTKSLWMEPSLTMVVLTLRYVTLRYVTLPYIHYDVHCTTFFPGAFREYVELSVVWAAQHNG